MKYSMLRSMGNRDRATRLWRRYIRLRVKWRDAPIILKIGIVLSCVWLGGITTYVFRNAGEFCQLAPNTLGDFLAGAFAPLAFLWLLVAVLLQKDELELQRLELRESRKALEQQAKHSKRSGDIAELEHKLRANEATDVRLCDAIRAFQKRLRQIAPRSAVEALDGNVEFLFRGPLKLPEDDDALTHACISDLQTFSRFAKNRTLRQPNAELRRDLQELIDNLVEIAVTLDPVAHPKAAARFVESRLSEFLTSSAPILENVGIIVPRLPMLRE